jgi:hypothetical protein
MSNLEIVRAPALYRPTAISSTDAYSTITSTGYTEGTDATFFCWFRVTSGSGNRRNIVTNTSDRVAIQVTSGNLFQVTYKNSSNSARVVHASTVAPSGTNGLHKWHWALHSCSLVSGQLLSHLIIDGVEQPAAGTLVAGNIDWNQGVTTFRARTAFNDQLFTGDLGPMYLNIAEYLDVRRPEVQEMFVGPDGQPKHLGDTGEIPTKTQPAFYFPLGNVISNLGSKGNPSLGAGTQTSVAGPARFYTTDDATYYDGTDRQRLTTLTGVTNGKVFTFFAAFRVTGGAATFRYIFGTENNRVTLGLDDSNQIIVFLRNDAGTTIAHVVSDTTYTDTKWHTLAISVNLVTTTVDIYVDRAAVATSDTIAPTDDTIDFDDVSWQIGASTNSGANWFIGDLHSVMMDTSQYTDFSTVSELDKLVNKSNVPIDLGADGSGGPSDSQPLLYSPAGNGTCDGSLGNFTPTGTPPTVDGPHIDTQTFFATPFQPKASAYDGANDYVTDSTLTGVSDSKNVILHGWFLRTKGLAATRAIIGTQNSRFLLQFDASDRLNLFCRNSSGTTILDVHSGSVTYTDTKWHFFHISISLGETTASDRYEVYVDGSLLTMTETTAPADDTIDLTDTNLTLGATGGSSSKFFGLLSNIYVRTADTIDFSRASKRHLFVDANGNPQFLGNLGELPTESQAQLYSPNGDPANDKRGTTVNWSTTGALIVTPGPPGPLTYYPSRFGSPNNHYIVDSTMTGVTNSKVLTFFCFFRVHGGAAATRTIWAGNTAGPNTRMAVQLNTSNQLRVFGRDTTPTTLFDLNTTSTYGTAEGWHYIHFSIDLSTQSYSFWVDGTQLTLTEATAPVDGTVDWTDPGGWAISAQSAATNVWKGDIGHLYINTDTYLDFTVQSNRDLFVDSNGIPKWLGFLGELPTGSKPQISSPGANPIRDNRGTTQNWVTTNFRRLADTDLPVTRHPWRTPVASLFVCDSNTPSTSVGDGDNKETSFSYGFTDGTRERNATVFLDEAVSTSDTSKRSITDGVFTNYTAVGTRVRRASGTGDGADSNPGPRANGWTVYTPLRGTEALVATCVLVGGDGWRAYVGDISPQNTSETAETNPGFQANAVLTHFQRVNLDDAVAAQGHFGMGIGAEFDGVWTQRALAFLDEDALGTTECDLAVATDQIAFGLTGAGAVTQQVKLVSTNGNGFTYQAAGGLGTADISYLALNTGAEIAEVATVSGPADNSSTWTVSSFTGKPTGAMFLTTMLASGASAIGTAAGLTVATDSTAGAWGVSFYDKIRTLSHFVTSEDGAGTSNTESTSFTAPLAIKQHDGTNDNVTRSGDVVVFDDTGFTMDQTGITTVTSASRQLFGLAFVQSFVGQQLSRRRSGRSTARGRGIGRNRGYRFRRIRQV